MKTMPQEGETSSADLMYKLPPSVGKQPTSKMRNSHAAHFGTEREKRMEYREVTQPTVMSRPRSSIPRPLCPRLSRLPSSRLL